MEYAHRSATIYTPAQATARAVRRHWRDRRRRDAGIAIAALAAAGLLGWAVAAFDLIVQAAVFSTIALPLTLLALLLTAQRRDGLGSRDAAQALAMAGLSVASWQLDRQRCRASPGWIDLLGAPPARHVQPLQWLSAAHPIDHDRVLDALSSLMAAGSDADDCCVPLRLRLPCGEWRWYELRARVLARRKGEQGRAIRLLTSLIDVSQQQALDERQRISMSLFQHLREGVLVTDTELRVLDANPAYCRMVGLTREALVGEVMAALQPSSLRQAGLDPAQMTLALQSQGHWQGRLATMRADGSTCSLQLTVSVIPEPGGPQRYRVITAADLTESLHQQQQLLKQSRFDSLTGLPNHEEFMRLLREGLILAEQEGFRLAVCRVDLDQFKQINRARGSAAADAVLLQVAQRLQAALRGAPLWSDVVARIGGDEFALLLRMDSAPDADEAERALLRLLNVLRAPYPMDPLELLEQLDTELPPSLEITASIGATLFPLDRQDGETLMRHAAHALYRAKHAGRNHVEFFDAAQRQRDEASLLALARLQQALDDGEFRLFYQPNIDLESGQVLGAEALLRWQHPERGLLAPAHFLPLIELTGLGVQVGDWVIGQALKQSARWLAAGFTLNVSVNVTARQLQMPDFALRLQELIKRHAEPVAQHLSLEVLESAALADIEATNALIYRCRAFGVSFALDDFGTGYSTLTYLKNLPVNTLKIDRSFVRNMLTDAQDMALIEGVLGLAKHFGCKVVAEGVESSAHARALLRMGCKEGQGNGIAAAMPADDLPNWIKDWTAGFARSPWRVAAGGGGREGSSRATAGVPARPLT
ncbi:EAL domain-containing protein [soil metagenome]